MARARALEANLARAVRRRPDPWDQVEIERIETLLQQMGFISVTCAYDLEAREYVVTARRNRREHDMRVEAKPEPATVVECFRRKVMRREDWTEGFNG